MIQITSPSSPPTVGPGAAITFSGNGGPANRYRVKPKGGGLGSTTTIDPPTGANWSVTITASTVLGTYTFTIFGEKSEDSMDFTVSGS